MMTKQISVLLGLSLIAMTAACDKNGAKVPSGQVVATVNGTDITVRELNAELAQTQAPPETPRKTIETVVLARVIERKMLADAARDRKLDQNPNFLLAQRKVDDGLLVQALQASIAQKVQPPTREAAEKFIAVHPELFANRKVYTIDQIQFLRPKNIAQLGLVPAKTMSDVEQVLTAANIEYRRQPATVDALAVNPRLTAEIERITARNPDEVFMFADQPQGAPAPVMVVNKVTSTKLVPFSGEKAIGFAQELLKREQIQQRLVAEEKTIAAAAKPKIAYAKGYGPPVDPAAGPAGAAPKAATGAATPATGAQ